MPAGIKSGDLRGDRGWHAQSALELAPPAAAGGQIWVVTPCKGRLSFVQRTAERILAQPDARYCLVDYSCPENVGDWVEQRFRPDLHAGRVVVERVVNEPMFNKCRAHNAGARRASAEGAEYLCFLDADTLIEPGFWPWIRDHARPDRFLIAGLREDGSDMPSMTGVLVVHARAFQSVGGFDEDFAGWGGEDIELRLRLFLLGGLDFEDVPLSLASPIPHGNNLRTQFYNEHSIAASNTLNMSRVHRKLAHDWSGRMVRNAADARRLWFQHSIDPCKDDPDEDTWAAEAAAVTTGQVEQPARNQSWGPPQQHRAGSQRLRAAAPHLHRDDRGSS